MEDIGLLFVEPTGHEHHGLTVVKIHGGEFDGAEYAVASTEDEASKAALSAAEDSLWAFNSEFIGSFLGLSDTQTKAIAEMQGRLCEDAQEIVRLLLGARCAEFVESAVDTDGRGHFLSPYDGEETDGEDVSPALGGKTVFRLD